VGLRDHISFEGQAAMELEFSIDRSVVESYPFSIQNAEPMIVDWAPAVRRILQDAADGVPVGAIAARFHNMLCEVIVEVAERIRIPEVVLTGGCFQNRYLTERAVQRAIHAGAIGADKDRAQHDHRVLQANVAGKAAKAR